MMSPGCGIEAVRSRACHADCSRRPPHLVISCRLLGLPMSSPPIVPSSSRRRLVISSRPSSRHLIASVGCLLASSALPLAHHLISHLGQFCLLAVHRLRPAARPASRPLFSLVRSVLPLDIAALSDRSPSLLVPAVIVRPALLVARLGAGRDGALVIACPSCHRCLFFLA